MDGLAWLAMGAAVTVSAHGEWALAVESGFHPWVAAGLPLALDTYALRALRAGREVFAPVLGMIATNAAAHLLSAGVLRPDWRLIVLVSAIAPLVLWRVHVLHATETTVPVREPKTELPPLWAEPAPAVSAAVPAYPVAVPTPAEPEPVAVAEPVRELEFSPLPPWPAPAAETPRTRPQPVDEYVSEPGGYAGYTAADQQEEPSGVDELTPVAAARFAEVLASGRLPSVRTLRAEYGIGQPRAQRVRDALRGLAGPGQVAA
ncbi:hypothetical protein [Kitasatospora camelliae]|uniref:DUF2637 domain-containing protein n=1 Tax=Kitasatospora camelliae TaxID=3156397 RepID=A0AAU8JWC8_9ACTN